MTDHGNGAPGADDESAPGGPVIRDKRRVDPQTGAVRSGTGPQEQEAAMAQEDQDPGVNGAAAEAGPDSRPTTAGEPDGEGDVAAYSASPAGEDAHPDTTLAEDLKRDLQRLNAEYVNYKRRVDRDRELHRDLAVSGVVEALLPVLDDIHLARQHGDLTDGPFAAIADKLEATLGKYGVQRFGEAGEAFDPNQHEALMHTEAELPEGTDTTTVVQVLQPGYRMGERVVRPARVAVADPH